MEEMHIRIENYWKSREGKNCTFLMLCIHTNLGGYEMNFTSFEVDYEPGRLFVNISV